jgi:hypothetical protein
MPAPWASLGLLGKQGGTLAPRLAGSRPVSSSFSPPSGRYARRYERQASGRRIQVPAGTDGDHARGAGGTVCHGHCRCNRPSSWGRLGRCWAGGLDSQRTCPGTWRATAVGAPNDHRHKVLDHYGVGSFSNHGAAAKRLLRAGWRPHIPCDASANARVI